jgi:ABC-type sugar transport system ATPase subunit
VTPVGLANQAGAPALEVIDASRRYGPVVALEAVSFELRVGEIMALVGENGAGKSTLVKILAGLVTPDSGTIRIGGRRVELSGPTRSRLAGIAVVQQELSLVGPLSAAENLFLAGGRRGFWTLGRLVSEARPFLVTVGLEELDPATPVERLSVAERQLVEIGRLLARDARILILDEPTAALSDREIARVHAVLRRLAAEGRSIIYVTHRLGEVFEIADRVTVFRNGRSQPAIAVRDLDVDGLVERMLGRRLEQMFPPRAIGFGPTVMAVDAVQSIGLAEPASLTVHAGEILGFAGQLGSGMGPLLRAIGGVQPMTSGSVTINAVALGSHSLRTAIRHGIAYCSEDRKRDGIFTISSVIENLTAPALQRVTRWGWISGGRERALAGELASFFKIDKHRLRDPVGALSGGNQQKVAVGKWMSAQPAVLLVEEPTRGVDVGARAEIYSHLRALAADGMAIVFASSDLAEVQGLADTVATFYRGRIVRVAPAADISPADVLGDVTRGSRPVAATGHGSDGHGALDGGLRRVQAPLADGAATTPQEGPA